MNALLGMGAIVIAALIGFFFKSGKLQNDEALLQNQKTKDALAPVNETLSQNHGELNSEEQKRKDIENEQATTQELIDFLNKPKS